MDHCMTFRFAWARRARVRALAVATTVAALAGVAPAAHADSDPCATGPADAAISLGPAADAESSTAAYSTSRCGRFVVDITADAAVGHYSFGGQLATSGPDQWTTVPSVSWPPTMACDQYVQALTVYQRSQTGDFVEVGSVRYRGELYFDSSYALRCRLVRVPRSGTLGVMFGTHSSLGYEWRVAFSARFGADYRPVRVQAWPWP
jgi:hypothetical protein